MTSPVDVKVSAVINATSQWQQIRFSLLGGGPGGTEIVVDVDTSKAEISVWNPYRFEWSVLTLTGLGDARFPREQLLHEAEMQAAFELERTGPASRNDGQEDESEIVLVEAEQP